MANNAQGIKAGRAYVSLGTDQGPFDRGLKAAERKLKAWGAGLAGLGSKIFGAGALGLAAFGVASKTFSEMGSNIQDMADRTGLGIEELQGLKFAAEQSGASFEDLEAGIKKMQNGLSGGEKAFGRLGLSIKELVDLSPEEQLAAVADAISGIENPADRTAFAMDILGKSGTKLLPMLQNGSAGLREFHKEAVKAGHVMSAEDVAAADAFGDAMDKLKGSLMAVVAAIGGAVAPVILEYAESIGDAIGSVRIWIKENAGLIKSAVKAAAVLAGIGAALVVVGKIVAITGAAIGALATVIGVVFTPVGAVLAAVAAAVAGVGSAFLFASKEGKAAQEAFGAAWGGIVNSVKSGDLVLAMRIAVAGMKVIWAEFFDWFMEKWKILKYLMPMQKPLVDALSAIASVDAKAARAELDKLIQQAKRGPQAQAEVASARISSSVAAMASSPGNAAGTFSGAQALRFAGGKNWEQRQAELLDDIKTILQGMRPRPGEEGGGLLLF